MGALLTRLRALGGNRLALAGLAGAAGLGAVALARGRGSGAAPSAAQAGGEASAGSAGGGQGAFPNTYATDLAAAVGDLDSRYAESLSEYAEATKGNQAAIESLTQTQKKTATDVASVVKKVEAIKVPTPAKKTAAKKPTVTKKPVAKKPATKKTATGWKTITIRRGDTLGAIARRYDTTVASLTKKNSIANPNKINAGGKLKVPV